MMATEFESRVRVLAREAEEFLSQNHDSALAEPLYERLLSMVADEPQYRAELAALLLEMTVSGSGPIELVEYCAHVLRWTELRSKLEALLLTTTDRRIRVALKRLLEAFEDDWNQRDIYSRWTAART